VKWRLAKVLYALLTIASLIAAIAADFKWA
jgi:hypothetical protein